MPVDELVAELQSYHAVLAPQVEGLKDFLQLVSAGSRERLEQAHNEYDHRLRLVLGSLDVLRRLKEHGYPGRLPIVLPSSIFADVKNNRDTVQAAFAEMQPESNEAVGGRVELEPIP